MARYEFGQQAAPLTPNQGQLLRRLWEAFAATPGARCPECRNPFNVDGMAGYGHAGYCPLARALRGEL